MVLGSQDHGLGLRLLEPVGDDLAPLLHALGAEKNLTTCDPAHFSGDETAFVLLDGRLAPEPAIKSLAPPTPCRVVAVISPPISELVASLGENLLLLVDAGWSPTVAADTITTVVRRFSSLQAAYDESENLLEIHQEVIKAAGETIRLKEELEERTRALQVAHEQIDRTRRLTALGSLGAGFAHELNNPLTSILGLAQLVQNMVGEKTRPGELLADVTAETKRVIGLVREFRRVVEQEQAVSTQAFDIASRVQAALDLVAAKLRERDIRSTVNLAKALPRVVGNGAEIQEAVSHLLTNASEALPKGGELKVRAYTADGEAVFVAISDNGPGIAPDLRERVFDPFFTTKSGQGKAGLGLSVTTRIVARHHGSLTIDDSPGGGATFTIMLPAEPKDSHLY